MIVSPAGYLLTNNHVIEGADDVEVMLGDGRNARAKTVGTDPESDIAVLKIELDKLPVIEFGDVDHLQVGDVVLAIGNPFGVGQTVTSGIVSALGRNALGINTFENFIQTDAAINPGNSGGALVDVAGNLLGINTAIYSRTGGSLGIGFAIPVSTARQVMESLIKDGRVTRGWIGVEPRDLTPEIAQDARPAGQAGRAHHRRRAERPGQRRRPAAGRRGAEGRRRSGRQHPAAAQRRRRAAAARAGDGQRAARQGRARRETDRRPASAVAPGQRRPLSKRMRSQPAPISSNGMGAISAHPALSEGGVGVGAILFAARAGFAGASRRNQSLATDSSGACVCRMNTCAAQIPTSYSRHIGIASASCETTSGGVRIAAMMKARTMK